MKELDIFDENKNILELLDSRWKHHNSEILALKDENQQLREFNQQLSESIGLGESIGHLRESNQQLGVFYKNNNHA
jgi:hypothetical protein